MYEAYTVQCKMSIVWMYMYWVRMLRSSAMQGASPVSVHCTTPEIQPFCSGLSRNTVWLFLLEGISILEWYYMYIYVAVSVYTTGSTIRQHSLSNTHPETLVNIRWHSPVLESATVAKTWACGRGVMRDPSWSCTISRALLPDIIPLPNVRSL